MKIFLQELRMNRVSFFVWLASLLALTFFFMLMYPPIAASMNEFLKVLSNLPAEFQRAFGLESLRFSGILGFYSFILTYILLAASIQAMNLGVSVLSAEVRDKTADFLYAKPVSRGKILSQKMLAILMQLLAANLIYIGAALMILRLVGGSSAQDEIDSRTFFLLTGTMPLLQLVFASIGLFVSAFLRRIRTVLPISMGVVFVFYFLKVLNDTLDNAQLVWLSPFAYFDLSEILQSRSYEPRFLVLSGLLIVVLVGLTVWSYQKKDLPAI